jgi:O-antigen/teichoic acid export membrane protein
MSLFGKSLSATIWTLVDVFFNKAIYFIATLILARLLGPKDFGTISMIMIFFAIGTTLIDSGLSISIIRSNSISQKEYSTIFYLNLGLSFLAYLIVFLSAPFISVFYNQEILIQLIRIYCLGFIITSLRMVHQSRLIKEMDFKKISLLNIPGNIIGLCVGVFMAINNYGVWSIVGLFLSTQITATITYWIFYNWRPSIVFSIDCMKTHWKFGYKLMISAQINTIFENIYNILIGKFYSIQTLGYYERAYTLNNYPISILSLIISKVSLPLFSQIADDKEKLGEVYKKIVLMAFYITAPIMLGALALAKPLFEVVLGQHWLPAVPLFQILCLSYILYPIHSLNINILTAFGKSGLFLKLEIYKKIVLVILVIIGVNFGIYGLVWSSVISSVVSLFINTYYTGHLISYNTKNQLKDLLPKLIMAIIMASIAFLISYKLNDYALILQLFVPSIVGVLIYVFMSKITNNTSYIYAITITTKKYFI